MATEWRVRGTELVNCNCATDVRANSMRCRRTAIAAPRRPGTSRKGISARFGLTDYGPLLSPSWPGPVHHGNGTMQIIVDERADPAQRDALIKIITGEETDPMATMWAVFSAMAPNKLETLFLPIEYEVDVDARRGRFRVPGLVETVGEPIRNPVTGAEHRARIDLPHGFEYRLAEIGSGTTQRDRRHSAAGSREHLRPIRAHPSQQQRRRRLKAAA